MAVFTLFSPRSCIGVTFVWFSLLVVVSLYRGLADYSLCDGVLPCMGFLVLVGLVIPLGYPPVVGFPVWG